MMEGKLFEFEHRLENAMTRVMQVLDTTKSPVFLSEEAHQYEDKFLVVERAANGALAAMKNVLESIGLDEEMFKNAEENAAGGGALTLRFSSTLTCNFLSTTERQEVSPVEHVLEVSKTSSDGKNVSSTKKSRSVTNIIEHRWLVEHEYYVSLFRGTDIANQHILQTRKGSIEVVTLGQTKQEPFPNRPSNPEFDISIADLFSYFQGSATNFKIDRSLESCRTPQVNKEVEKLSNVMCRFASWAQRIVRHFEKLMTFQSAKSKIPRHPYNSENVLLPIAPLMKSEDSGEVLDEVDVSKLIDAHRADLRKELRKIGMENPGSNDNQTQLITAQESQIVLLSDNMARIGERFNESITYVENLIRSQLITAIGKEVTLTNLDEYMRFHYQKVFPEGTLSPFVFDIKREGYSPEGTFSIETAEGSETREIATFVQERQSTKMKFSLSAATKVEMRGKQILHAYLCHQFSAALCSSLNLIVRARQFSSFLLIVGKVISKDTIDPQHAIIIQNKDRMVIPLLLEPLPSAKAFRDAIESLSPEQQEFARAFREMQLGSTVFALAVVEIKPQLEILLHLPEGSLTKEIKLTQDLMKLFIEFQVPSDLVTYDGQEDASIVEKLNVVKGHVKSLLDTINAEREKELEVAKQRAKAALAEQNIILSDNAETSMPVGRTKLKDGGGVFGGGGSLFALPKSMSMNMNINMARGQPPSPQFGAAPQSTMQAFQSAQMSKEWQPPSPMKQKRESSPPLQDLGAQKYQQKPSLSHLPPDEDACDLTQLPGKLDKAFESSTNASSCLATKIVVEENWTRESFSSLLAKDPVKSELEKPELLKERSRAMDLLDAISRSGDIPLIQSQLHVILATTHSFDDSIMKTIANKNVNPIPRIEASARLILETMQQTFSS